MTAKEYIKSLLISLPLLAAMFWVGYAAHRQTSAPVVSQLQSNVDYNKQKATVFEEALHRMQKINAERDRTIRILKLQLKKCGGK